MPSIPDRRRFLALCSAAGLSQTLLPGTLFTLAAQQAAPVITPTLLDAAVTLAGLTLTPEQRAMMLDGFTAQRASAAAVRRLPLPNSVAPALVFDPVPPGMVLDTTRHPLKISATPHIVLEQHGSPDAAAEAVAFLTVRELAELIRTQHITSTTLTRMYLARLKRLDAKLHCVITLTEDRALKQAAAADAEIASGHYRGPLHGIPWGAKDLLAVKGYPTTWGAAGFEDQHFDTDAEVVQRLDNAGAVLIAKLSMGALAQGDLWFKARTRTPWNIHQGSSGSSAGSASATAAGCVGFALGTETQGSISAPSTRCGATGLRPTFGLVPRTGAMALSWSMDKIGPICRAVEDCAIVLSAIYGPDGHDLAVQPAAFNWDAAFDVKTLRIGYLKSAFDPSSFTPHPPAAGLTGKDLADATDAEARRRQFYDSQAYDLRYLTAALETLRNMGVTLIPVELPDLPFSAITPLLSAEGAAAFDTLTRTGRDQLLTGQRPGDWPNSFRIAHLYSAVDYIQANRARSLVIAGMHQLFQQVDIIVTPSQGPQLAATNLSGHPAVIIPNGLRGPDAPKPVSEADASPDNVGGPGTPVSLTFLGALYSDARLAAFARAYQQATPFHTQHPPL